MKRSFSTSVGDVRSATIGEESGGGWRPRPVNGSAKAEHDNASSKLMPMCAECQSIDFERLFAASVGIREFFGRAVTTHRMDFDPSCYLCTCIFSIHNPRYRTTHSEEKDIRLVGYHLRIFDSLKLLRLQRNAKRLKEKPSVVIAVVPGPPTLETSDTSCKPRLNLAISKGLIVPLAPSTQDDGSLPKHAHGKYDVLGRKLHKTQINYPLLREWISECESLSHGVCRIESSFVSSTWHVIDCHSRTIVPLQKNDRYIALSYVWGAAKPDSVLVPEHNLRLPTSIPATIEDAIQVVKALHERYLWVDRYCVQNHNNKHLQIQEMGLVYESAIVTIVAVSGQDAGSGLPGVSCPRFTQPSVRTAWGTLVSTGCHMSHHLASSRWATRGWTYQETFLSRRCLFFTPDQVYFACRATTKCESVRQMAAPTAIDVSQQALDPTLMKLHAQIDYSLERQHRNLRDHLLEYTSRSLTFEQDVLKAFAGMLARQKCYSFWGVPFLNITSSGVKAEKICAAFACGLAWQRVDRSVNLLPRRKDFPSWSWTSVHGGVLLNEVIAYTNYDTQPDISVEDPESGLISIAEMYRKYHNGGHVIPELTPYLHLTCVAVKVRLAKTSGLSIYEATIVKPPGMGRVGSVVIDATDEGTAPPNFDRQVCDAIELGGYNGVLIVQCKGPIAYRIGFMRSYVNWSGVTGLYRQNLIRKKTFKLG